MSRITVLVADDHPIVRSGVRYAIEDQPNLTCAGEAEDGQSLLEMLRDSQPDLLLLDVNMPHFKSPVKKVRMLKRQYPEMKILIYTIYQDAQLARDMLDAGAQGFVTKDEDKAVLVSAILAAARDRVWLSSSVTEPFLALHEAGAESRRQTLSLTPREEEILDLIGAGATPEQIATNLNIAISTVRTHQKRIYAKLGVTTIAQAALYARQRGSSSPDPPDLPAFE